MVFKIEINNYSNECVYVRVYKRKQKLLEEDVMSRFRKTCGSRASSFRKLLVGGVFICAAIAQGAIAQDSLIKNTENESSVLRDWHLDLDRPLTPLDFSQGSELDRKEIEEIVQAGPSFHEASVQLYVTGLSDRPLNLKEIVRIDLCAQKKCVPANVAQDFGLLKNSKNSRVQFFGESQIRADTLTHVRLHSQTAKGKVAVSEARLQEPLFLQYMVNRAKLLLSLQQASSDTDWGKGKEEGLISLAGVSAVYEYDYPGAQYIFYNPLMNSPEELPYGVKVRIPAGALKKPAILISIVSDTGGLYPSVNILPDLKLAAPMELKVPPFSDYKTRLSVREGDPDAKRLSEMNIEEISVSLTDTKEAANLDFEMMRRKGLGNVNMSSFSSTSFFAKGISSCINDIKSPDFQEKLDLSLKVHGIFHIPTLCVSQPPYVHIVATDSLGAGGQGYYDVLYRVFRYDHETSDWLLSLSRSDSYNGFRVLINGFTWRGDRGFLINTKGVAQGFVKGYDYNSGNRYTVGRNSNESGAADGRKMVASFSSFDHVGSWRVLDGQVYSWPNNTPLVISSSTSILRNGVCSGGADENRWSAVGEMEEGKMVFISSTSRGETTVDELCQVFLALGVRNAIRFDGGSAAALVVNGTLLNPLGRIQDVVFGPTRRVAWVFGYK